MFVAALLVLLPGSEAGALCNENNHEDPRCTCGDEDLPAWAEGRDGDGKLQVRRYRDREDVTRFPRDRETSCLGWPIVGTERWGPNLGFGTRRAGRKHSTAWVMPDTHDRPECDARAQGKPTIVYRMADRRL